MQGQILGREKQDLMCKHALCCRNASAKEPKVDRPINVGKYAKSDFSHGNSGGCRHEKISCNAQITLIMGLILAAGAVNAQSAQAAGDAVELDSVSVTGVRASIQKSLLEKHAAGGIVDAISAEDIGKFPDLNLSESLQRIPGVNRPGFPRRIGSPRTASA